MTVAALLAVTSLLVGAAPAVAHSPAAGRSAPTATPRPASAPFVVQGSVEQVAVTGAAPGTATELHDDKGRIVAKGTTDAQGALLFRDVTPASGYTVTAAGDVGAGHRHQHHRGAAAFPLHVAATFPGLRLSEDARRHDTVGAA